MPKPIPILAAITLFSLVATTTIGDELRTYRFIADGSLPYSASCGECAPTSIGAKSDVEGTFTVSLDLAASKGTLLSLNDQLVNHFDVLSSPTGPILQPSSPSFSIIPHFVSYYQRPLEGTLESVGGALILKSNGQYPTPDGLTYLIGPSFTITMQDGEAAFDMHVPIIDYAITVTGASAVQIPEPASLQMGVVTGALILSRRLRRTSGGRLQS